MNTSETKPIFPESAEAPSVFRESGRIVEIRSYKDRMK